MPWELLFLIDIFVLYIVCNWNFFLILQVTDTNVEIVNIDYNTKFNMIDAKRKQTGIYKIIATNKHGKDEAEVELVILCKCIYPSKMITLLLLL